MLFLLVLLLVAGWDVAPLRAALAVTVIPAAALVVVWGPPKCGKSFFVFDMVARLRDEGLTVLLVEQKARQALKVASRAYLMETGKIFASGPAQELVGDEVLSNAFLGAAATKS